MFYTCHLYQSTPEIKSNLYIILFSCNTARDQIENAEYTDIPNMEDKGWKKSVEDYWKWYEKQGSFKEISKTLGHCLDGSVEDLETAEKDIMHGSELNCQNEIT